MVVTVRRIEPTDGPLLARIRLDALRDSPAAFASSYDDEARRSPADWELRARQGAAGSDRVTFFACLGGTPVGLAGGYWSDPAAGRTELVSVWVSPSARRRGAARALVRAVVAWASDSGATSMGVWVAKGNAPAMELYAALGFDPTGECQPLPSDPTTDEVRMVMPLPDR